MNSQNKPTLKTIAEKVGVHPSTVSRVLNESKTHRVDPKTKKKILQAVEQLQYKPDPLAQSLRTKKTMMLGITVPRLTDFELAAMVTAAQRAASAHGYETLIVSTESQKDHNQAINSMIRRRIDGLIIATALLDDPVLTHLETTKVPFLLLNRENPQYNSISSDDYKGAQLAVNHLISQGHKHIAHIAGHLETSTGFNRFSGYKKALEENQILFREDLTAIGNFDSTSAYNLTSQFLELTSPPTAIFAVNDISALGAMAAIRDAGLKTPQDVAIVGYNNSDFSSLIPIPMTSVSVPIQEMGKLSVDLLLEKIKGDSISSIKFEPELIIRKSSQS